MKGLIRILCGAAALTACASPPGAPPLPPADYAEQAAKIPPTITQEAAKRLILANRSKLFKDPDSVRDAKISDPFTCFTGSGNCICIEANAKNAMGGYAGLQLLGVQLDPVEAIGEMAVTARAGPCGRLVPFPALNASPSKRS